jgi:hypothetical protein
MQFVALNLVPRSFAGTFFGNILEWILLATTTNKLTNIQLLLLFQDWVHLKSGQMMSNQMCLTADPLETHNHIILNFCNKGLQQVSKNTALPPPSPQIWVGDLLRFQGPSMNSAYLPVTASYGCYLFVSIWS